MVLHGEKAHSRYFGEDAFKRLSVANKELVIIPGASHTDLNDGGKNNAIPFVYSEYSCSKSLKSQQRSFSFFSNSESSVSFLKINVSLSPEFAK